MSWRYHHNKSYQIIFLWLLDQLSHFFFASPQVRLDCVLGHRDDLSHSLDGQVFDIEQGDDGALGLVELCQCRAHRQAGFGGYSRAVGHGFASRVIVEFLRGMLCPSMAVEFVVGDAVEPGGETRQSLEVAHVDVGLEKSLLCQVVGERFVAAREVHQESAQLRLIGLNQLPEGLPAVAQRALRYQSQFVDFFHCFSELDIYE